jgi:hypothetical protein
MNSKCQLNRRDFLHGSLVCFTCSSLMSGCKSLWQQNVVVEPMSPHGPASTYVPTIKAAFVRRKEDYGMWWPGAVYEKSGKEAQHTYTAQLTKTAKELDVKLELRPEPIYSTVEADAWLAKARNELADGLMLIMMDRQQHSWPTAYKAVDVGIPTVVFSPLGTSFTTNTAPLADKPGCVVYSAEEFDQALYGMKMLGAGAKMRHARCVVLKGNERFDESMAGLGITLRHIPAKTYLDEYQSMDVTDEVLVMAEDYLRRARRCIGATRQNVINGVKGYFVVRRILEREKADAITMDCLGTLADKGVSLPCIAWSRMNDEGIPAACEADYGAVASHIIVQYLFGRPGFQQDPVADTVHNAIIGAHCSSPTRLKGFNQPPEPFDLMHHHGNRDAVPRTLWRKGQRITCIDAGDWQSRTKILISVGTVLENVSVPPNGGCVVSVKVKFDGDQDVLNFPGFHQLFFYGDYKRHLREFCQLFSLQSQVV